MFTTSRQLHTLIASLLGLVIASTVSATDTVDHIHLDPAKGRRSLSDTCETATLRTANGEFNAESTIGKSQSTGLGTCNGLSSELGPGVWFAVTGTGNTMKASTCHLATEFKATILVYSGSTYDCASNTLTCVNSGDDIDYECQSNQGKSTSVEWKSLNGASYYILVQSQIQGDGGTVWMNFRSVSAPVNDECKKAIGPIPPVDLQIDGTTADATVTSMSDYCGINQVYPGVWYSFFGSGSEMVLAACSNTDARFAFSIYQGLNCDSLTCVVGKNTYSVSKISGDQSKCLFQQPDESLVVRDLNEIRFQSVLDQRYYVYLAFEPASVGALTGDFRLFINSEVALPTFPPIEVPTRAPSAAPSQNPTPHGVTAFPTRPPTSVPLPTTPTIIPLGTQGPITGQSGTQGDITAQSSAPNNAKSMLVILLFSLGALVMNEGLMW